METFQHNPSREAPSSESDLFFKEGLGRQIGTVVLETHHPEYFTETAAPQDTQDTQTQVA